MKHVVLGLLLMAMSFAVPAQHNYAQYCRLQVGKGTTPPDTNTYVSPQLVQMKGKDNFFYKHSNRFQYVLFKQRDSFSVWSKLYPDTVAIQRRYAAYINNNPDIDHYFSELSGNVLAKTTYTKAEMKKVASRFFLCDNVNEDSTVTAHICIGINGQKELASTRDLTTLEAFCFEAIFYYLGKNHDPAFYNNFGNYKRAAAHATPFNANFLESVKNACYNAMENDKDLEQALLHYYKKNKGNLGFVIL